MHVICMYTHIYTFKQDIYLNTQTLLHVLKDNMNSSVIQTYFGNYFVYYSVNTYENFLPQNSLIYPIYAVPVPSNNHVVRCLGFPPIV